MYRELQDVPGEGVVVDRACLRSSLPPLAASCDATFNSTDSSRLRVVMSSLVHACTHFDDDVGSVRRLRVIAGVARLYPELQRLSTQFSAATGIPVYFNFSTRIGSSGVLIRSAMARPPPVVDSGDNTAGGADAFITTTSLLPNLDQGGKLLDMNGMVGEDGQLRWYEINKALREQMVVYGNKVVGIPVTTSPVFLFYHKPVFARDNLTVPVTWDQVIALAERYNGTDLNGNGLPGYGMCMTPPDCFVDGTILQWILSSFVQTQGYSQGLILDPDSLANLANSSAMIEALTIMKRLRRVGPLSGNCAVFEDEAYLEGRCLLSITTPTTFKAAYSPEKPARFAAMRGRMGMAPFPGSTRVLDRASGNLTDCDTARCPMARVKARDASGMKRPVNQPAPSSNIVVMLNAQSPVKYQFYAYSLFSYLLSPNVLGSDELLLDPRLETVPFRDTDLTPDANAAWVARGYDPSDVDQFLTTLRTALSNPNQNFENKFPGNVNISARCTAAAVMYTNATPGYVAPPLHVVLGVIGSAVDAVVKEQGGAAVFGPVYRFLLNWGRSQYSSDGSVAPGDDEGSGRAAGGGGQGGGLSSEGRLVLAIAVPCAVGLIAVATVAALWRWNRRRAAALRRGRGVVVAPPGAGPDTTLLVTDIQSSTSLWEHLDAGVMDRALSTHHAVMRKAIADWAGYESATEGDSFIVAFRSATEALMCALAAQQALLDAAWPQELLDAGPGRVPGLEAPELDPLAQVGAVPVTTTKQAARSGRLAYTPTLTQRAAIAAGRSRNGSARSWSLFGGPSQAPAAAGLGGALGVSAGGADEAVAADPSPWYRSIGARRRAVSGSGHEASPVPHASEADETRTHDDAATEDTEPHATAAAGASEGEEGGYQEGTDGAGPSSSGWVGPDSTGTSCFTPISLTAAAAAAATAAAAAATGSTGGTPGADGGGRAAQHATVAAAAGAAGPGSGGVSHRAIQSPFEPAAGLMAYGDGPTSSSNVLGRVSSRAALTGPPTAAAAPATAPLGAVVHSTASGVLGLGSGLLKAFSNITAAVGGHSSGGLWRLASAGASAGAGPPGAAGSAQGPARPQVYASCSQPAAGGRVSGSGALVHDTQQQQPQQQAGTPTAFRSSVSLSANQMSQWLGHRLTNESGGAAEPVHAYLSLAVKLSRSVHITRLQPPEPHELSSVVPSPSGARRANTPTTADRARTWTGGGRYSNDGSTPGAGADAASSAAAAVVIFRGLRVRMGLHTGVASAAEVTVNATSGRTQYSGDCITWAKHVSDTAHGGMVVFGEATRQRLDADAVRAARPYVLYSGLHVVGREGIEHTAQQRLHLYTAYGSALLPRALVVRPLVTASELRPGVLAAPVGHGTVVQVRVVGAERLLCWDYELAAKAMQVLHACTMQLLSGLDDVAAGKGTGTGGSGSGAKGACASWASSAAYVLSGGITLAATGHGSGAAGAGGPAGVGGGGGEAGAGGGAGTGCGSTAGVMTLVFPDTDAAVSWAAALRARLPTLEWPTGLLEHELCEEVWAPAPSGAGFGDGYRFVARPPLLRHAMTANLPLTGGGAGGGGAGAAGGTGGGGAPAPRFSNNGSSNPLARLSSAFRARLGGAPPSPVHSSGRARFGNAAPALSRAGGAGAAPGSPHSVAFARTSDSAGAGTGGQARLHTAGSAHGRRVLGHCLEEAPHEGEDQQQPQPQPQPQPQSSKEQALPPRRVMTEQAPELAARVRAAIAASRASRGEGRASIESQAPPAPATPAPSSQLDAAAAFMTSTSSDSGPRRSEILLWRAGAEKQQAAGAAAGAPPGGGRSSPPVAAAAVAAGSGALAALAEPCGASLDELPAQLAQRGPSSQGWAAQGAQDVHLPMPPPPSPGHAPWPAEAAAAAAAALAVAPVAEAAGRSAGKALTGGEGPASPSAGRSTAGAGKQLPLADAAVKPAPAAGLAREGRVDVPAVTSSVEIEVHTSPVGWPSTRSQRSHTHSGPLGTAGTWSNNSAPGGHRSAASRASPTLVAPAAAPSPGAGPSSQPAVSTPAAKAPLSAAAAASAVLPAGRARAPFGPGAAFEPSVTSGGAARAALPGTAGAGAAIAAAEEPAAEMAPYAAVTTGAGGAGEALVPLRLLYRGLRLRAAVACGPLKGGLVAGDVSGHVVYRGKAFTQLAKLMAKAKTGQIVATADLARTLPPSLSEELTLIDKL
ncbi:hypothetical protein HXX76_005354 [Chlamydomonas incerta]|uniref:Guanylate cyclase domain-containing protein n=1 Tax=Chlamydomonas incerta TaxID=51695 RepID=A0A835T9B2_CHLIN|nr:hypothetical protein HXX76_005354 [Chlamydomonas incerta]|eukprot:KAG2438813.1 hypothetical protein HXX76_005354 [Chlamydomonas incerta]